MTTPSTTSDSGRLRVLEIIGNAIIGGMEAFVSRFCEQLQRSQRFDVICLCPYESAFTHALRALGVAVHVAPIPEEPVWRGIEYGAALVADEGIDVIHAHLTNAHLLAGIVGRMTGTPVLATIHGRDVQSADVAIQRMADTHLHVVSRATLYQALGVGVRRERVSCIVNGVDADRFQPGRSSGALRATCGIGADVPLIGFVGRFSPEKGPDLFVRAAALALMRRPEAHAVMIGDGPMFESIAELGDDLGIGGRLHLTGVRNDIPDCLRDLTMLVSSSRSEGAPLVILEAQATGLPVVATQVGGLPEIVAIGETGILVPAGEADSLANAVVQLLGDRDLATRIGAAARVRMSERFALPARNAEVAGLLASLIPETPAVLRTPRRPSLASVKANGSKLRNGAATVASAPGELG